MLKKLLLSRIKNISNNEVNVSIYLESKGFYIELLIINTRYSILFSFEELIERYSDIINLNELFEDINFNNKSIFLEPLNLITKKSISISGKMHIIIMFEKNDRLIFEIFFGTSIKKFIILSKIEAIKRTKINYSISCLGNFIIENCINIHDDKVKIKYKKYKINMLIITKIQAVFRGILARKKLNQEHLILVSEKIFNGNIYKLYCFYYGNKYEIKAISKTETLSLRIDKKESPSNVLHFLRKQIIQNLQLNEKGLKKLIYNMNSINKIDMQESNKASIPKLSKSATQINKKSYVPLNFINITPNINISDKELNRPLSSSIFSTKSYNQEMVCPSPKKNSRAETIEYFDMSSNNLNSEPLSPSESPIIKIGKYPTEKEGISKSTEFTKVILKTGINISGIYLIVTMELKKNGIFVKALNESGLIDLELFVTTKRVQNIHEKAIEDFCTELLGQLIIVSNLEGKMRLAIIKNNKEDTNEIIYKKSHYISSRYFTITIFENYRGVYLIATENEKNVFNMKLGKRRVGNSQKVQEELSELVQKLKIQVVLGQEMLVLSSNS